MLIPAQCEKVVTISERKGRPQDVPRVPKGSKTPLYQRNLACRSSVCSVSTWYCPIPRAVFRLVFSGLRAERGCRWKRLTTLDHYLPDRHRRSTQRARFGPNFVTIQPTGVCLCST